LFWLGVVVALVTMVGGGWYAYAEYRATSGPAAAVRGYFAALARSDAPAALAYGTVPDGPHDLLTSAVLARQQQLAPLHDVHIVEVAESGDDATVHFSYRLQFASDDQEFTGSLQVHDTGSGWRLAQTAVATTVQIDEAVDRFTFAGTSIPDGATLLFPGAVPLHFDTPNLQVDPATAAIQFGGANPTEVELRPSPAVKASMAKALTTRLAGCLAGKVAVSSCPAPPPRVVPGSLRGSIDGLVAPHLRFTVASTAAGVIEAVGRLPFQGSYRSLSYTNVVTAHRGSLTLSLSAVVPASGRLTIQFAGST
jgi:hypothetical protein